MKSHHFIVGEFTIDFCLRCSYLNVPWRERKGTFLSKAHFCLVSFISRDVIQWCVSAQLSKLWPGDGGVSNTVLHACMDIHKCHTKIYRQKLAILYLLICSSWAHDINWRKMCSGMNLPCYVCLMIRSVWGRSIAFCNQDWISSYKEKSFTK